MPRSLMWRRGWVLAALAVVALSRTVAHPPPGSPPPFPLWANLSGGAFSGHQPAANPDPIANYSWNAETVQSSAASHTLQSFAVLPQEAQAVVGPPPDGLPTLLAGCSVPGNAVISGPGTVRFCFGVELAGWVELLSPDLTPAQAGAVTMSVSEMSVPQAYGYSDGHRNHAKSWKTAHLRQHAGGVWRLEFHGNEQLYEGLKFAFLHVSANLTKSFSVSAVRAVAQVKPVNWVGGWGTGGAFPLLDRAWYVGAYTVKLNLLTHGFGEILDSRGDRHALGTANGGDGYPAHATSAAAFGNYEFIWTSLLNISKNSHVDIEFYEMTWVQSVVDYYMASGDDAGAGLLIPAVADRLDKGAAHVWHLGRGGRSFVGWGERTQGAGFLDDLPEDQRVYAASFVRACRDAAAMFGALGNVELANRYNMLAANQTQNLTKVAGWWRTWGPDSLSQAVLAGIVNPDDYDAVYNQSFGDPTQICAFSNFNQYFILQALERLQRPRAAIESVELCWGAELKLGATTFWEVSGYAGGWANSLKGFGPPYPPAVPAHGGGSNSLCHPWSAGVTAWLSRSALGVRPTVAGYADMRIQPLLLRVHGLVPTLHGTVNVTIDAVAGEHAICVPHGADNAEMFLPCSRHLNLPYYVTVNGSRSHSFTVVPANWSDGYFDQYVHLSLRTPGCTTVTIANGSDGDSAWIAPEPSPRRPAAVTSFEMPLLSVDTSTRGDWISRYGSAGYVLFGWQGDELSGSALTKLPAGVGLPRFGHNLKGNATLFQQHYNLSAQPARIRAALLDPTDKAKKARRIGAAHTESFGTSALDIPLDVAGGCWNVMRIAT